MLQEVISTKFELKSDIATLFGKVGRVEDSVRGLSKKIGGIEDSLSKKLVGLKTLNQKELVELKTHSMILKV